MKGLLFTLLFLSMKTMAIESIDGLAVSCGEKVIQAEIFQLKDNVSTGDSHLDYQEKLDDLFRRLKKKLPRKLNDIQENVDSVLNLMEFVSGAKFPRPVNTGINLPMGCTLERVGMFVKKDITIGHDKDRLIVNEDLFENMDESSKAAFVLKEVIYYTLYKHNEETEESALSNIVKSLLMATVSDVDFYFNVNLINLGVLDLGKNGGYHVVEQWSSQPFRYSLVSKTKEDLVYTFNLEAANTRSWVESYEGFNDCWIGMLPRFPLSLMSGYPLNQRGHYEDLISCKSSMLGKLKLNVPQQFKSLYLLNGKLVQQSRKLPENTYFTLKFDETIYIVRGCSISKTEDINIYQLSGEGTICKLEDKDGNEIIKGKLFSYNFQEKRFEPQLNFDLDQEVEFELGQQKIFVLSHIEKNITMKRTQKITLQYWDNLAIDYNLEPGGYHFELNEIGNLSGLWSTVTDKIKPVQKSLEIKLPNSFKIKITPSASTWIGTGTLNFRSELKEQAIGYVGKTPFRKTVKIQENIEYYLTKSALMSVDGKFNFTFYIR